MHSKMPPQLKHELINVITKIVENFDFIAWKNPYLPGDLVRIQDDIKDAYGEVWHTAGDVMRIKEIAADGNGLMFDSNLGIHWTRVERVSNEVFEASKRTAYRNHIATDQGTGGSHCSGCGKDLGSDPSVRFDYCPRCGCRLLDGGMQGGSSDS